MVNRLPDKYTLSFLFKKNFLLKFKSHFSLQHHRQIFHCLCLVQTFIIPLRQLRHVALTAGIKTTNFKLGSDSNECVPFTNACRSPRPCNIVYSSLTTCSLHFSHLEKKKMPAFRQSNLVGMHTFINDSVFCLSFSRSETFAAFEDVLTH